MSSDAAQQQPRGYKCRGRFARTGAREARIVASVAVENKKTQWPIVEAGTADRVAQLAGLARARRMSRRQRTAPKANISPSVRLGLTSIVAGNEAGIRTMLSAAASDDLVEKLAEPHVERGL